MAAEEATQGSGGMLAAVLTLGGLVITGVVTVLVALINRGKSTPIAEPDPPAYVVHGPPPDGDITVRERLRVVEFREDARDHADEIVDRRLDQIERHLDLTNVRWRHPFDDV